MEWIETDRPELLVIGWAVRTRNEQEADPAQAQLPGLWERATAGTIAEHVPHVAAPDTSVAVIHDYESDHDGAYTEVVGAQTTTLSEVPEGMVGVRTQPGRYAVVPVRGPMPGALVDTWSRVHQAEGEGRIKRAYTTDYELHREGGAFVELHLALAG